MAFSARTYIDCREFPSERNCSLKISGTADEVLAAAEDHARSAHGHTGGRELKEQLRGALREER